MHSDQNYSRKAAFDLFDPLLRSLSGKLPIATSLLLEEFVDNFEYGVALDWLTAYLQESSVQLDCNQQALLAEAASFLGTSVTFVETVPQATDIMG